MNFNPELGFDREKNSFSPSYFCGRGIETEILFLLPLSCLWIPISGEAHRSPAYLSYCLHCIGRQQKSKCAVGLGWVWAFFPLEMCLEASVKFPSCDVGKWYQVHAWTCFQRADRNKPCLWMSKNSRVRYSPAHVPTQAISQAHLVTARPKTFISPLHLILIDFSEQRHDVTYPDDFSAASNGFSTKEKLVRGTWIGSTRQPLRLPSWSLTRGDSASVML